MLWIGFVSEDLLKWSAKDWNLPFVVLVVGVYLYIRQFCEQKREVNYDNATKAFWVLRGKGKKVDV